MNPLDFLLTRRSFPVLVSPAPGKDDIHVLMQAALRAPDHGNMKPYRFVVCEADALTRLGDLYVQGMQQTGETDRVKLDRARGLPLRAPMVIVAVACVKASPKIPGQEQLLTAGLATFQLINAAQALGFGAYWRTGDIAYNPAIWRLLGLADGEQVIGYVYVGSVKGEPKDVGVSPATESLWTYL